MGFCYESQKTNKGGYFRWLSAQRRSPATVSTETNKMTVFAGILACNRKLMNYPG